ncbi:aminotransferase class IV family protein [Corynebacterium sp.]|uniref:aminotransferase class IV family protein n=1 Tax=Corynebacterium sp. TaxID=1720 RepID=UPI0028A8E5E4|nr:aminotransferase class IV family protein [Corynebacterium sp.]
MTSVTHLNGIPVTAADLAPLAFAGYAHFTAMQMREHSVRGLDLHLRRLSHASDTLFGRHLPDDQIIHLLRAAVEDTGRADASLTCFITSRPGEFAPVGETPELDVLVKMTAPAQPPAGSLSLDIVRHERHLPEVKHAGEVAKTLFLRRANARGFDDAAFMDHNGRLSEATIWNLAFWDGGTVVWPEATSLPGVTMQILRRRLAAMGVPQQTRPVQLTDVEEQLSGVVMNSWSPGIPISQLGDVPLQVDSNFAEILAAAYEKEPQQRLR